MITLIFLVIAKNIELPGHYAPQRYKETYSSLYEVH